MKTEANLYNHFTKRNPIGRMTTGLKIAETPINIIIGKRHVYICDKMIYRLGIDYAMQDLESARPMKHASAIKCHPRKKSKELLSQTSSCERFA